MSKFEQAEKIADKARESISEFCMNECKAYCCRKGYIMVNDDQLNEIATKAKQEKLKKEEKITEYSFSQKFKINFTNSLGGCPALKDNKCTIHKNPKRPKVCHEYPIFVQFKEIRISSKCPAQQQNKLYPYIQQLHKLGYKITYF